jgi:hypothetical protein
VIERTVFEHQHDDVLDAALKVDRHYRSITSFTVEKLLTQNVGLTHSGGGVDPRQTS